MSMSHVFDLIWQWRKEFQFKPDNTAGTIDLIVTSNPTNPEVAGESEASSTTNGPLIADTALPTMAWGGTDLNFDLWDPLSWLDESLQIPMEPDSGGNYPMSMPTMH